MFARGLHSGMAITRQRRRRKEQIRARERRFSARSLDSNMSSLGSIDGGTRSRRKRQDPANFDTNVGIGMLHVGFVFLILGAFLLASGLIPDDFDKFEWEDFLKLHTWWNELVVTGCFSLFLGIFLLILNKFVSGREEAELEDYVSRQLNRSRSGHQLVRDVETGNLTTKRSKSFNVAQDEVRRSMVEDIPEIHTTKSPPALDNHPQFFPNGELLSPTLEQIAEEESSDRGIGQQSEGFLSTTASMSTMSPCDANDLLMEQLYQQQQPAVVPSKYHQVRMTKI